MYIWQWAPDGKMILFGMSNGEIHIYDSLGNFMVGSLCVLVAGNRLLFAKFVTNILPFALKDL